MQQFVVMLIFDTIPGSIYGRRSQPGVSAPPSCAGCVRVIHKNLIYYTPAILIITSVWWVRDQSRNFHRDAGVKKVGNH